VNPSPDASVDASVPELPDAGTPDGSVPEQPDAGTPDGSVPEQPDSGTPDASTEPEWDGTYVPLEELGDSVDPGRFDTCTVVGAQDGGTAPACGSPESFDLSSCNLSTLGQLSPSGIYGVRTRSDSSRALAGSGFRISATGGPETVGGQPLVRKIVGPESFYVAGLRTLADGGTTLSAYVGCRADNVQRFTGCYQSCTNGGARRTMGTFEGERLQRLGEPESSGGLTLVSERKVELGEPVDIYVAKNHAYVVSVNRSGRTGGLTVFDVTDRANPVLRKTVTMTGDSYWNGVWAKGDGLYVASGNKGVLVFDISNPADPQFVRNLPGPAMNVHTVFVDGERLYAMDTTNNQVLFFDVSAPLRPVQVGSYGVPSDENGMGYPHDSFAYQNRLYINQMGQGYYVVDVENPSSPRPLGVYTYDAHLYAPTHANAVGTFGGRTIAFEGGENNNAHLRVLDVTDPARIVKIGEVAMRTQTSIHNMVLVGKRLYVAWYAEGVRIFDVSIPTQPRQVAHYNTFRDADPGRTEGLFVSAIGIRVPGDGFVYVVDMTRGLLVLRQP
jgi:hypothetical protein